MIFDPERYPQPEEMVKRLHDLNFHLMISIWPGLGPDTGDLQGDGPARVSCTRRWAGPGFKYYDAFNPDGERPLLEVPRRRACVSKGIDAWWIDSTEPDVINALTKESSEYELKKMGRHHLGSWSRHLNSYSLVDDGRALRQPAPSRTTRSASTSSRARRSPGSSGPRATTWSGDIGASWDIYRKQIAAGRQLLDVGDSVLDVRHRRLRDRELRRDVLAAAARTPRTRSSTRACSSSAPSARSSARTVRTRRARSGRFGEFAPVLVKFDRLRYRLLPYIYSLAWQVTSQGYTIMRGLPMDFRGRPRDLRHRRPVHVRPGAHGLAGDRVPAAPAAGAERARPAASLPHAGRQARAPRALLQGRGLQDARPRARRPGRSTFLVHRPARLRHGRGALDPLGRAARADAVGPAPVPHQGVRNQADRPRRAGAAASPGRATSRTARS